MIKKIWSKPFWTFGLIFIIANIVTLTIYYPFIRDYIKDGVVFSGSGDGFRQMMPFQLYLYEHFTQLKGFYDHSFGLGGDYVKGLAYYYSLTPIMWVNFIIVWIGEHLFHWQPQNIRFWPTNQLIVAYVRTIITFICAFYYFRYLKLSSTPLLIATILYGASTVVLYYNFTWSFYGDLLIILPLSLWGMERFFQRRKIGLFIFAVAITLFSNFYFTYYQAIVLGIYFILRVVFQYRYDIVSRWQKCYLLIIGAMFALLSSILGFYTGVSSFLNNDRQQNSDFNLSLFTDLTKNNYYIFSNGFYVTISLIALVALLTPKLYKHYYYKIFAIITWFLLIGSLSQYFDSAFNGFSLPQRRWVYFLVLSTSGLIALYIYHLSELTMKQFLFAAVPVFIGGLCRYIIADNFVDWMVIALIIIVVLGIFIYHKSLLKQPIIMLSLIVLFFGQQIIMTHDSRQRTIDPYSTTINTLSDPSYYNDTIAKKIDSIKEHHDDPFHRIDYMSAYALNSPFLYHYNGISLYSSIFDGGILKYYDKLMQINMPVDKNSTYRFLGNRANLTALWNVQDRLRHPEDQNMTYGFEKKDMILNGKNTLIHSKNMIDYPSAHVTNHIYNSDDLKSPLDREQAMLKGIVLNDNSEKANTSFKANKNLLNKSKMSTKNATWKNQNHLKVHKDNGGVTLKLPESVANQYKDMYVEMDVELLSPDKAHSVGVNEYSQNRNELSYKYRRLVTPVTMRVKASDKLNIHLSKGNYRLSVKDIYGEDYSTLKKASKELTPVKVKDMRNGYVVKKPKNATGYVILPTVYANGMHAKVDGKEIPVHQANGIMTAISVNKGDKVIKLTYTPPQFYLLAIMSFIGVIGSILFSLWVKKKR
ncbi:YfhO family protein [Staphylococcus haemolyticus]|uniref:YfhO family protein n=1 Tax=Staphylococcus haemolyticus TaxID=1283 RepID=UPI0015D6DEC1|nr:YfhO family protein [Staphylococcus haemolyticus]